MGRGFVRKRSDPLPEEEVLHCAVTEVINKRMSIRVAAVYFGLKKSTLGDYVKKVKENNDVVPNRLKRNQHNRQILTALLEIELVAYLLTCSMMSHGLTPLQTRKLAFTFALANNVKVPNNWIIDEEASRDWFTGFLKRHPTLSIRAPEQSSQSRASGFNRPVVDKFFENLMNVLVRYKFPAHRIWNTDECGIPTVLGPPKVIAKKGLKQVQQTVSHERGVNTTMIGFISASGTPRRIPPVYIFPRKKFLPAMTNGGPAGCVGLAHPSGWVNGDTFLTSLVHFVEFTGCSKERPHLLLLDNHGSHLEVKVIDYARANGIVMLTFPPHCSHRLQLLDLGVFGPFKTALKVAFNDWLQLNPGQRISIHQVAALSRKPFERAFTTSIILSSFAKAGIHPFDRNIFTDEDFLPSFATDRPDGRLLNLAYYGFIY